VLRKTRHSLRGCGAGRVSFARKIQREAKLWSEMIRVRKLKAE